MSLDVVSLFTWIPTCATPTVIQHKLAAEPSLEKHSCMPIDNLIIFCVEMTYFRIEFDTYQLEERLAIRSPVLPGLVYVCMEYFEEMALGSTSLKPSLWLDEKEYCNMNSSKKSYIVVKVKVVNWSRGQPEGTLFNSYYTKV